MNYCKLPRVLSSHDDWTTHPVIHTSQFKPRRIGATRVPSTRLTRTAFARSKIEYKKAHKTAIKLRPPSFDSTSSARSFMFQDPLCEHFDAHDRSDNSCTCGSFIGYSMEIVSALFYPQIAPTRRRLNRSLYRTLSWWRPHHDSETLQSILLKSNDEANCIAFPILHFIYSSTAFMRLFFFSHPNNVDMCHSVPSR